MGGDRRVENRVRINLADLGHVEAVVYEADQGVDYKPVENFLHTHNFICESDAHKFQSVCVRRRLSLLKNITVQGVE